MTGNVKKSRLQVKFNLNASVVNDFIHDLPNNDLQGLRSLLDAFGASVLSTGKFLRDTTSMTGALKQLGNAARKTLIKDPQLANKIDGEIMVELDDDRNIKAFVASLELGPYDDVIDKESIQIDTHVYYDLEVSQAMSGIVQPPYPPSSKRYVLK